MTALLALLAACWQILPFYIAVQAIAFAVLPLTTRIFRFLPDRGYGFAKPFGLLVITYLLWIGALFGILPNVGATVGVLVASVGIATWLVFPDLHQPARAWLRHQRRYVLSVEALFLVAFVLWAFYRSYVPEIAATEKPMEFGFLSAILRSPRFPPTDPWLSGYGISYYYLGYVMIAAVTELAHVSATIAYNLANALLFALTIVGAFSVGFNLCVGSRLPRGEETMASLRGYLRAGWLVGGLTALLVGVMGNWEGLLEVLHAHGWGTSAFWNALAIKGLAAAPLSSHWYPTDPPDVWWWFRASRIIAQPAVTGSPGDYTINEFPFFSFLLGDLHPHVLALPFLFVGLGFVLNVLRSSAERDHWLDLVGAGFLFGALFPLNAWDILTGTFLLLAGYGARIFLLDGCSARQTGDALLRGAVTIVGLGLAFFWPFYFTFQTQASGVPGFVPVRTDFPQFLIFWGPLLALVLSYVILELVRVWPRLGSKTARGVAIGALLVAVAAGAALFRLNAPALGVTVPFLIVALLIVTRYRVPSGERDTSFSRAISAERVFVILLAATALLLVGGCELFYVRDLFNNRMNTVFKFYYQAWQLWAVVGAYGVWTWGTVVWRKTRLLASFWFALVGVLVAAGFVYPPAALLARSNGFSHPTTFDGLAYYARINPDDAAGIRWLSDHATGTPVVVEATGGSYSAFGRVSWMTGLPTLLGWDFHEVQWRGTGANAEIQNRKAAIDTIYTTGDSAQLATLLQKYHVTYIYVGPLERQRYSQATTNLTILARLADVVYQNPSVTIYRVRNAPSSPSVGTGSSLGFVPMR